MASTDPQPLTLKRILLVALTGVGAGLFPRLLGMGGGPVAAPTLMTVLGTDQRRISATSLTAIIVTVAAGSGSYALYGGISWTGAVPLVVGVLADSQIGMWLLRRPPTSVLPWILISLAIFVIVS